MSLPVRMCLRVCLSRVCLSVPFLPSYPAPRLSPSPSAFFLYPLPLSRPPLCLLLPVFYHPVKLRFRVAGIDKTRVRYYLVFIVLVKSICARRCAFAYVPAGNPEYIEQLTVAGGVTSEIASKSRVCRVHCSFCPSYTNNSRRLFVRDRLAAMSYRANKRFCRAKIPGPDRISLSALPFLYETRERRLRPRSSVPWLRR